MKSKLKRVSRRTLSIVLVMMMLVSTSLVGMFTTTAATVDEDSSVSATVSDNSSVGDGSYFTVGETLYVDYRYASYNVPDGNAKIYIKFFKSDTVNYKWVQLNHDSINKIYYGFVPDGEWDKLNFVRTSPSFNSGTSWDKTNIWANTAAQTVVDKGNNNCWEMNGGNFDGKWSTYSGTNLPSEQTPKFADGKGETNTVVAIVNRYRDLYVEATLDGVDNPQAYLSYMTEFEGEHGNAELVNVQTSSPKIMAYAPGTYKVKTTVTNFASSENLTIERITTVRVLNPGDVKYRVCIDNGTEIDMTETPEGSGIYMSNKTIPQYAKFCVKRIITNPDAPDEITYSYPGEGEYEFKYLSAAIALNGWRDSPDKYITNNCSDAITVKYDVSKGHDGYGAIFSIKLSYIYAKDGTLNSYKNGDVTGTGTGNRGFGTTTVTTEGIGSDSATITDIGTGSIDGGDDLFKGHLKKYRIDATGTVKVNTQLNTAIAGDYYVHAFVVNGKTYLANASTDNNYYAYIPVQKGSLPVEITPIYYHTDCKTEGKYIKFYVNTNALKGADSWGDTIANYAYYYKGDWTNGNPPASLESDSGYPGQPMLYDNDLQMYYVLMPKYMYEGDTAYPISGITVNNYYEDSVHKALGGKTFHRQTFDFNNMKYIAALGSDIVRLGIVPRCADLSNKDFIASGEEFNPDTFVAQGYNQFDNFTNINGDQSNIFRQKVAPNAPVGLYIVAYSAGKVENVGEYATNWAIYDAETREKITTCVPSDLIPRDTNNDGKITDDDQQTTAYEKIKNLKIYDDKRVMISNASRLQSGNTFRYDARWFYINTKDSEATVNVKYQTSEDGTDWSAPLQTDINNAYIEYDGNKGTEMTVPGGSTVDITANAPQGYIFKGFGTVDNDGKNFTPIESSKLISPEITFNMNYVARFVKARDNTLTISHKKYDGKDAKGGAGLYKVEASILNAAGDVVSSSSDTTTTGSNGQEIVLTVNNQMVKDDYKLKITLTTITIGANTFRNWYQATEEGVQIIGDPDEGMTCNGVTFEKVDGKQNGRLEYTFSAPLSNYFGYNDYQLKHSALRFYSDIYRVTKDYTITYKYQDRFGNPKSFVAKGTHNDDYYPTHGNSWTPDEALVKAHAPAIDDLYKNCIWKIDPDSVSADGTSVTVYADQVARPLSVFVYDEKHNSNSHKVYFNEFAYQNKSEQTFYTVPTTITVEETNGDSIEKTFQYWAVIATEENKNITETITEDNIGNYRVSAKCFSTMFNIRITDHCVIVPIYSVNQSEDVAFISDAQYSREQYTVSGKDYDYIYADFIVAYMERSGILLNSEEAEGYQSGILVEYDKNIKVGKENILGEKLSDEDKKEFAPEQILSDTQIETFISNGSRDGIDVNRKLVKFNIDNSLYNNKNRLDYYVRFNNTNENFRQYVYRAYYYVIDDTGEVTLSDPVYFYLYDIGNSVYVHPQA